MIWLMWLISSLNMASLMEVVGVAMGLKLIFQDKSEFYIVDKEKQQTQKKPTASCPPEAQTKGCESPIQSPSMPTVQKFAPPLPDSDDADGAAGRKLHERPDDVDDDADDAAGRKLHERPDDVDDDA